MSKTQRAAKKIERGDIEIAHAFNRLRNTRTVRLIGKASDVGDQPPLYVISAAVLAGGVIGGDRRAARAGLRMLAAHFLAIRLKNAVKHLVDRTRPYVLAEDGHYTMQPGTRTQKKFTSFPSGHTASSVAVARAIGGEYPGGNPAAIGLASAIAVAQVVRSKHYVTDLIAGAAIGIIAQALADRWLIRMAKP